MKASKYQNSFVEVTAVAAAGENVHYAAEPVVEGEPAGGRTAPASAKRLALLVFSKEDRFGRGCFIAPTQGKKAA